MEIIILVRCKVSPSDKSRVVFFCKYTSVYGFGPEAHGLVYRYASNYHKLESSKQNKYITIFKEKHSRTLFDLLRGSSLTPKMTIKRYG